MNIYYLDSSAWVKRYFAERGSDWVERLFRESVLASSGLGYVEVTSAITRQEARGRLDEGTQRGMQKQLETDWGRIVQLEATKDLFIRGSVLARERRLRGADAVHLATAEWLKEEHCGSGGSGVILVTSDEELVAAGQAIGMRVENPVSFVR